MITITRKGIEFLATKQNGRKRTKTYRNKAQAEAAAEKAGPQWQVFNISGRPTEVGRYVGERVLSVSSPCDHFYGEPIEVKIEGEPTPDEVRARYDFVALEGVHPAALHSCNCTRQCGLTAEYYVGGRIIDSFTVGVES